MIKMMDKASWQHLLHRRKQSHKYDFGHVLVIGGSQAMAGAPVLAARAALRIGAGLVTIASTSAAIELIDRDVEEIMTLALPPWQNGECKGAIQTFVSDRHVNTIIIGPGLPHDADELIRYLLPEMAVSTVVDAEAFSALSGHLSALKAATRNNPKLILTPHPGEYERLVTDQVQSSPAEFAQEYRLTLVLKGHRTMVAAMSGEIYENKTGNPGLATAGSGDVLSGVIAGLLAQNIEPYQAAKMGVYLHGLAGDLTADNKTEPGMIASDIIEAIPLALKLLDSSK